MPGAVRDNGELSRFELEHDGHLAVAYYRVAEDVITFMHTEVPSELSGRGMGSRLIAGALDEARRRGLKVTAECPFVSGFIAKHPEYRDLPKTAEA